MLKMIEKVTITGESVIDGKVVCSYTALIDAENPENMVMTQRQNDKEAYKANRNACRNDQAEFEDAAYNRQDEMIAAKTN